MNPWRVTIRPLMHLLSPWRHRGDLLATTAQNRRVDHVSAIWEMRISEQAPVGFSHAEWHPKSCMVETGNGERGFRPKKSNISSISEKRRASA